MTTDKNDKTTVDNSHLFKKPSVFNVDPFNNRGGKGSKRPGASNNKGGKGKSINVSKFRGGSGGDR